MKSSVPRPFYLDRKIVVTGGFEKPWKDEFGIETIGIVPFLLDPQSHLS